MKKELWGKKVGKEDRKPKLRQSAQGDCDNHEEEVNSNDSSDNEGGNGGVKQGNKKSSNGHGNASFRTTLKGGVPINPPEEKVKKLFSGKQKKELMKEERARKEEKRKKEEEEEEAERDRIFRKHQQYIAGGSNNHSESDVSKIGSDNSNNIIDNSNNGKNTKNKLTSMFKLEEEAEVVRRKLLGMETPIIPRYSGSDVAFLTTDGSAYVDCRAGWTFVDMPMRIPWERSWTPECLDEHERKYFDQYKADIVSIYFPELSLATCSQTNQLATAKASVLEIPYQEVKKRDISHSINNYECNIEVWRQLWRVVERSDIILILCDVRCPKFTFPPSLFKYVYQVLRKPIVVVMTKIDLVHPDLANAWKDWFRKEFPGISVVLYTSHPEESLDDNNVSDDRTNGKEKIQLKRKARVFKGRNLLTPIGVLNLEASLKEIIPAPISTGFTLASQAKNNPSQDDRDGKADKNNFPGVFNKPSNNRSKSGGSAASGASRIKGGSKDVKRGSDKKLSKDRRRGKGRGEDHNADNSEEVSEGSEEESEDDDEDFIKKSLKTHNSIFQNEALDSADVATDDGFLTSLSKLMSNTDVPVQMAEKRRNSFLTLGIVGLPNSGKSSFINGLVGKKVVSVSRTPGHTKHLQTIFLNKGVCLCDCPGLVFPMINAPYSYQVLFGLINIAQVRETYSTLAEIATCVPLVDIYELARPTRLQDEVNFSWTGHGIAEAYAEKRQYFISRGRLDLHRAGNELLRHVTSGRVLFALAPPKE